MTEFYDVNRLGRDLMDKYFDKKNVKYKIRQIKSDTEFEEALFAKIIEETQELLEAKDEDHMVEEMCDVIEVFRAILDLHNISWEELEEVRKSKVEDRGAFKNRLFIEKLSEIS